MDQRKSALTTIQKATTAIDDGKDIEFDIVITKEVPDRVGDIVRVAGLDTSAVEKNGPLLFGHSHNLIIGTIKDIKKTATEAIATVKLAAKGTSRIVDEARALVQQGILKASSIGFRFLEYKEIEETGGLDFIKSELLELSLVAVPANKHALRVKGYNIDPDIDDIFFSGDDDEAADVGKQSDEPAEDASLKRSEALKRASKAVIAAKRELKRNRPL